MKPWCRTSLKYEFGNKIVDGEGQEEPRCPHKYNTGFIRMLKYIHSSTKYIQ